MCFALCAESQQRAFELPAWRISDCASQTPILDFIVRARPVLTRSSLFLFFSIPLHSSARGTEFVQSCKPITNHRSCYAPHKASLAHSRRYVNSVRSSSSYLTKVPPLWQTDNNTGERKDFEVYSCHVSPDGKRLVTAAGGARPRQSTRETGGHQSQVADINQMDTCGYGRRKQSITLGMIPTISQSSWPP